MLRAYSLCVSHTVCKAGRLQYGTMDLSIADINPESDGLRPVKARSSDVIKYSTCPLPERTRPLIPGVAKRTKLRNSSIPQPLACENDLLL